MPPPTADEITSTGSRNTVSVENSLIAICGASRGIGAATARELASRGYHVLAGVRTPEDAEAIRADRIEPVMLDITISAHVEALAARVAADPQQRTLTAVINNAGSEINAPVEVLPLSTWCEQFDVNFFGHIAVTQALLPALRRSKGRVVNISSVGGEVVLPIYGAYASTKFALEAASDALRREVASQGIQVVVVQSGGVKTVMADRSGAISLDIAAGMSAEHRALYSDLISSTVKFRSTFLAHAIPAARAGAKIARIATTRRPRPRYTLGLDAAITIPLNRLLPTRIMDRVLSR